MAVTRPLKEGSVTTYQAKVAAGFPDILASEMDADLDTIYAAWNTGCPQWTVAGGSLTPVDATKGIRWGSGVAKYRLRDGSAGTAQMLSNSDGLTSDDPAQSQWLLSLNQTDSFKLFRSPPGASAAWTNLLTLDSLGQLTVTGATNKFSTGTTIYADGASSTFYGNQSVSLGYNSGYHTWGVSLYYAGDQFNVLRDGTARLSLDASCNLTLPGTPTIKAGTVYLLGSSSGVRCANVGTVTGDGYSNVVAFGWDGTLKARIDSTPIGTVTVTSDKRLKRNVAEDVPGLDAVCALRPISFEYDQTKRPIGFPKGRHYGLLAQDVEPHAPLVVGADDSEERWLEIDYRLLVPVLIQAVKELAARVETFEAPR